MSWTSPITWVDGDLVTAAQLNEQLRDNTTYLFNNVGLPSIVVLRDVKSQATNGGTPTGNIWNHRDLNTESDPKGICTLASNRFKLAVGSYYIDAVLTGSLGAFNGTATGDSKAKLENFTTTTDVLFGQGQQQLTHYNATPAGDARFTFNTPVVGIFTVTDANHEYRMMHYVETGASYSWGLASSLAQEVYSIVTLIRLTIS
jgi:hypothetical protein